MNTLPLPTGHAERRSLRETALFRAPYPLQDDKGRFFGPPLLPLTPWHHLLLLGYANPFVTPGAIPTLDGALQYCWLCSPQLNRICRRAEADTFHPPIRVSGLRFFFFAARWRRALSAVQITEDGRDVRGPSLATLRAIEAHLALIVLDRPALPVTKKKIAQAAEAGPKDGPHELAAFELVCVRHLRYSEQQFWHRPYAYTNQLLALHFNSAAPDAPHFDRERDQAAKRFLLRRREEKQKKLAGN